jgi:hypothetical protein
MNMQYTSFPITEIMVKVKLVYTEYEEKQQQTSSRILNTQHTSFPITEIMVKVKLVYIEYE